jgi:hypothetical protein
MESTGSTRLCVVLLAATGVGIRIILGKSRRSEDGAESG